MDKYPNRVTTRPATGSTREEVPIPPLKPSEITSFAGFFGHLRAVLKNDFYADRFDYLINNAGVGIHKSFAETSEDEFDQLKHPFQICFLPVAASIRGDLRWWQDH